MNVWLKAAGITVLQVAFLCLMLGLLGGAMYLAYVSIAETSGWSILFVVVGVILYNMTKSNKRKLEEQRERATKAQ